MTLLAPYWLFLLVPLLASLWLWRPPTRLLLVLRILSLVLVVAALAGLAIRLPSRAGTVVVIADRSLSMPPGSEAAMKETIDLVRSAMGAEDRLAVVSFGQRATVEQAPDAKAFAGFQAEVGGHGSSLGEAIDRALSLVPRDAPGRLLVLSDGKWTGRDPLTLAPSALARDIAIDYRGLSRGSSGDLAIARIDAPTVVSVGESYLITGWVHAPAPMKISYVLKRGGVVIARGDRDVVSGRTRLTFRDRASQVGNQSYTLHVEGAGAADPVPENNTARLLVGVSGPRPLLHVGGTGRSGLVSLLQRGGLDVRPARAEDIRWNLEDLSRYSGVILENLPAERIGHNGMETLAALVRETGAGLFMTGGRTAYGPGGYYKSPLDPLLPVSMELRNEHRKLSLAIVVALDRSGSMAVPVTGGRKKMDLANLGTAQVLDLLGPMDEFGCIAVDTLVHTIAPLGQVKNKAKVRKDILSIESMGGGIYVYEALAAAAQMLLKAKAGTRHIILFSDAADSEEPGAYRDLLEKCRKAGITVSVIGLGTNKDTDAKLLEDIAKRGNGRIFFTAQAEELPRLFAQDTFVVARNTFLDEPVKVRHLPGLATLLDQTLPSPASLAIGGYNLCYLRKDATLSTRTLDDYQAPVVASWRAGAGRVVCYTGEADGKYAGAITGWDRVGDYFTGLARWAAGAANPLRDNMLLTQEVREGVNLIHLHLDPERKREPFASLPQVTTLRSRPDGGPRTERAPMRWTGADTLTIEMPLDSAETALATVDVPGHGAVALPPVCLPYSPEFTPDRDDRGQVTLERLGRATGGKERVQLADIWKDLPRQTRLIPIGRWLLLAVVILWLLEVLERRTGLLTGGFRRKVAVTDENEPTPRKPAVRPQPAARPAATASPAVERVEPPPPAPVPREEREGVLEAMRRARRRARDRTE